MNCELIYQKINEKTNKNHNNGGIAMDRSRAVSSFNEEQNRFIEWVLQKKNTDAIHDIQNLLVREKLKLKEVGKNFASFTLPNNFFAFSNIKVTASNGTCTDFLLPVPVKPENQEEILFDENNKPSFKYRECPYFIQNNSITILTDNFTIDNLGLLYYRNPKPFNIKGYIDESNQESFDSEPEFSDRIVDRIISMVATSFDLNNENFNKIQFDMNRTLSRF